MHEYRQVLLRLRQGDSDRDVARSGLMGRPKTAAFRALAQRHGWLSDASPLPACVFRRVVTTDSGLV